MTQCFVLTQKISKVQAEIKLLEQCLHCSNTRHEAEAELFELANTRQISMEQLQQEIDRLVQKLDKLTNLLEKTQESLSKGQTSLLYFVKFSFLLKETVESYWDFFLREHRKQMIKELALRFVDLYKQVKSEASSDTPKDEADYVFVEALKHSMKSLIEVGLRVNAFSQEEVTTLNLGDITPQESETVLVFLSTMKKWEPVYKRLAAS